MSFSSIPGTSIFKVMLCSSSYTSTGGAKADVVRVFFAAFRIRLTEQPVHPVSAASTNSRNGSQRVNTVIATPPNG